MPGGEQGAYKLAGGQRALVCNGHGGPHRPTHPTAPLGKSTWTRSTRATRSNPLLVDTLVAQQSKRFFIQAINMERTCVLLKPDAVGRGLNFQITERFEKREFKLLASCVPRAAGHK